MKKEFVKIVISVNNIFLIIIKYFYNINRKHLYKKILKIYSFIHLSIIYKIIIYNYILFKICSNIWLFYKKRIMICFWYFKRFKYEWKCIIFTFSEINNAKININF